MSKKNKKVSAEENEITNDVSLVSEKKSEVIEHSLVTGLSAIL